MQEQHADVLAQVERVESLIREDTAMPSQLVLQLRALHLLLERHFRAEEAGGDTAQGERIRGQHEQILFALGCSIAATERGVPSDVKATIAGVLGCLRNHGLGERTVENAAHPERRDAPAGEDARIDEAGDESFPASDPPWWTPTHVGKPER
jgi:hypothetical protein